VIRAGLVYHVPNRGNGRLRLFRKDAAFAALENVLADHPDATMSPFSRRT
jgi:hypothetical protein